uniref:Uncharacterized protein n=1 Tax=Chromera velia CCMP2878 TaxID=1169474 RepID=A0A0G4GMV8_9ALVE|eukprot:Cvel_22610.t1-p1 / transcript=Cvel_22610.t1 / gene=Cvel_22610 / organism=Chromera_velia_CCMP2878 / gene_product=hypothetical protein / transcript_product=hypothetical protein / location=Cvel_scaffold2239:11755-14809(+) / protein_length=285 / sequence_SO=supercontig / SO=protein_coding / is_pseudo=false
MFFIAKYGEEGPGRFFNPNCSCAILLDHLKVRASSDIQASLKKRRDDTKLSINQLQRQTVAFNHQLMQLEDELSRKKAATARQTPTDEEQKEKEQPPPSAKDTKGKKGGTPPPPEDEFDPNDPVKVLEKKIEEIRKTLTTNETRIGRRKDLIAQILTQEKKLERIDKVDFTTEDGSTDLKLRESPTSVALNFLQPKKTYKVTAFPPPPEPQIFDGSESPPQAKPPTPETGKKGGKKDKEEVEPPAENDEFAPFSLCFQLLDPDADPEEEAEKAAAAEKAAKGKKK